MNHKQVDFVIAGQPKSGTTALAQFLDQHPQVCMAYPKEPAYFATDLIRESDEFHGKERYFAVRTPEQYDKLFTHAESGQILGEASTSYAYSKEAAENIYEHNPETKIIIMLRHPVDFLHSLHMQYVNEATENEPDFKKALLLEQKRKKGENIPPKARCPSYHFYMERINYAEHIERFCKFFGQSNVLLLTNKEFRNDNKATYQQVLEFLGLNSDIIPEFTSVHGSKQPRINWLLKAVNATWLKNTIYRLLGPTWYTKVQKGIAEKILLKPKTRNRMDPQLRKELIDKTRPEVEKLDRITGKNYSYLWGYSQDKQFR